MVVRASHARPAAEVCEALAVDARTGLAATEAARRLERDGTNRLEVQTAPSRLTLLARQFGNSMVLLLVVAAAISVPSARCSTRR